MKKLLLTTAALLALSLSCWGEFPRTNSGFGPREAEAHAIIPQPSNFDIRCGAWIENKFFVCWCDEWLRYPLCKRVHWHRGNTVARWRV